MSWSIFHTVVAVRINVCTTAGMQMDILHQVNISKRNHWMPSFLTMRKNQRIAHWDVTGRMLRDSLQLACIPMLNDNVSISWLIVIFGLDNDSSDFICCRTIITTGISILWI